MRINAARLRMRELALGRIKPEGIDLTVLTLPLETIAYRFLAAYEWEVSEFSLATYCAMPPVVVPM